MRLIFLNLPSDVKRLTVRKNLMDFIEHIATIFWMLSRRKDTKQDRLLLQNLANQFGIKLFRYINWTAMDENTYEEIRKRFTEKGLEFNWRLEEYWEM